MAYGDKQYFDIRAEKGEEVVFFKVSGVGHRQEIWNESEIEGLSENGLKKIRQYRKEGYGLTVAVGNHRGLVRLLNN